MGSKDSKAADYPAAEAAARGEVSAIDSEEAHDVAAPAVDDVLSEVDGLGRLADEIASLRDGIARLESPERVGASLRRLAEQLEHSRREEWRPLFRDLILLVDRVERGISAWEDNPPVEEFISTIRDELVEILARRGVAALELPDGPFDPSQQRAVQVAGTEDPEQDRHVVAVVRRGYEHEGYLLRPEEVVVARFERPEGQQ